MAGQLIKFTDPNTGETAYATNAKSASNIFIGNKDYAAAQDAKGYGPSVPSPYQNEPTVLSSSLGRNVIDTKINPVLTAGTNAITQASNNTASRITYDQSGLPTDGSLMPAGYEDLVNQEDQAKAEINRAFQKNQDLYSSLAVANTNEASAEMAALRTEWDQAHAEQEKANKLQNATYEQAGFRTGQARYAPELNASMLNDVQSEGIAKLTKLDSGYRAAIDKIRGALETNNLQLALQASNEAKQYHEKTLEEIQAQRKTVDDIYKKAKEARATVSRQAAILDLVKQGITNPTQLFNYLNFDEQGNQVGDISAEEIDQVLSKAIPSGSALGGFKFSNDDVGKLIGAGLKVPEIQSMLDDLNQYGPDAVLQGLTGTQRSIVSKILNNTGTGTGNTLTISEARGLGVPLSLVGRSETQILSDLSRPTPPSWFREYVTSNWADPSAEVNVQDLTRQWQDFRGQINDTFVSGKTAGAAKSASGGVTAAEIDAAFGG